jgi:hypothetical protein
MTRIEDILSRALLVRDRTVPRDIVPPTTPTARNGSQPAVPVPDSPSNEAAEDLRALCETLLTHTPAPTVAKFVTDQVPEPRSALIHACVLQLTDTDDGARFWWQYAAGAGQAAAAYCLYLHHRALGEDVTADWWHSQTDEAQPPPEPPAHERHPSRDTSPEWSPAYHPVTSSTTSTILRILHHLGKHTVRPRTAAVTELMAYIPTAVTVGYLREPEMELPLPGADFARRIKSLLAAAANRPDVSDSLPARPGPRERASNGAAQPTSHPMVPAPRPGPAPAHPRGGTTHARA